MRNILLTAAGAAMIAGVGLAPTSAAAQYYYYYSQPAPQYYYPQYYGYHQPTYVPPRIARKQAQQYNRFVEKYGYVEPQYHYYAQPRVRGYYYQHPGYYGGSTYGPSTHMSYPGQN